MNQSLKLHTNYLLTVYKFLLCSHALLYQHQLHRQLQKKNQKELVFEFRVLLIYLYRWVCGGRMKIVLCSIYTNKNTTTDKVKNIVLKIYGKLMEV